MPILFMMAVHHHKISHAAYLVILIIFVFCIGSALHCWLHYGSFCLTTLDLFDLIDISSVNL